jgi:hypothetical protein
MFYLWIIPHLARIAWPEDLTNTAYSDKKPLDSQAIFYHMVSSLNHGMRPSIRVDIRR